ncbi:MAG: AAA family ATPase [Promethearchaeota archaeon]
MSRKIESNQEEEKVRIQWTDNAIKEQMGSYGAIYFPEDVKETIDDIIGCEVQKERLDDFFKALKKYEEFKDQLKNANLTPNLTVLLYGPPGTGKTTLTRAFAKAYNIPICVVEADRLVSSMLGETIGNIRGVIETASQISDERGAFILFFDEIDAIGSERSNKHEVGEIKRAVISFLQHIDRINYEGHPLAIIGATNHQQQLDSAIWRRFTFHLSFEFPDYHLRKAIMERFLARIEKAKIGIDNSIQSRLNQEYEVIKKIEKDIEKKLGKKISEFSDKLFWDEIIKNKKINGILSLTHGYSGSDLERGTRVALFKAIHSELLTYDMLIRSLNLVGGTADHVEVYENSLNKPFKANSNNNTKSHEHLPKPPEI